MSLRTLFEKANLTRRGFLKGVGSVVAASTVYGCSKEDSEENPIFSYNDNLVFDYEAKPYWSTGPYNCGARCVHKVYAKNGRLLRLTSAGDIPLEGCKPKDEEIGETGSIQRRACVRGYSYLQRLYQPDRLKYPLLQTKERGDITGFKRISWEEAFEIAGKAYADAYARKAELGYTPILDRWDMLTSTFTQSSPDNPEVVSNILYPIMMTVGNESTGAADAAKYDCVGVDALANNMADRFNSDFIMTWGLDPSRSTYHVAHAHWYNTKAREKGIPVVVITSNYNDAAAVIASGFSHSYSVNNISKTVEVPGWIPCRPATDGALAAAMAYVMYKNDIYDKEFVQQYCFGFYKNDEVVSTAPNTMLSSLTMSHSKNMKAPNDFTDDAGRQFKKGEPYTGATFRVPAGESFEEYLLSLEVSWAGAAQDTASASYKYKQPQTPAVAGDAVYQKVLAYAAKYTGVKLDYIEALAFKYARPKGAEGGVSLIDAGGGPQRAMNGVEWNWLAILLTAMTGHIAKSGGGPAYSMMSQTDVQALGLYDYGGLSFMPPSGMLADAYGLNKIHIIMSNWSHLILTGKDYKSRTRFIDDIEYTCGKDLADKLRAKGANEKLLEVDVFTIKNGNYMTTAENINKNVEAMKAVRDKVIVIDQTMTPSAVYADLVLPAASHFEQEGMQTQVATAAIFLQEKAINPLFDVKYDNDIIAGIQAAFDRFAGTSVYKEPAAPSAAGAAAFGPSKFYMNNVGGENRRISMDIMKQQGFDEFVIPPSKPLVPFGTDASKNAPNCILNSLETTTGKINFYSPLWGKIRPKSAESDGFRSATAEYLPNIEGYEKFFDESGNFTGFHSTISNRTYKLLYMTNKARNRAHTVLDNVAMIKDSFPQTVKMNHIDAAERGIKNGDMVYVYNDRGCTRIPAELTQEILPGVISIEHGAWYRAHPTEKVIVWMNTDPADITKFEARQVPLEVGGAENILTYEVAGTELFVGQATSAQGGPCEVSLTKPE